MNKEKRKKKLVAISLFKLVIEMEISKVNNSTTPLCILPDERLVYYRRGQVGIVYKGKVEKLLNISISVKERLLGWSGMLSRLLRFGVRAVISLDSNNLVLSIGNMLYELNLETGRLSNGYFCGEGVRPLIFTNIRNVEGVEDGIYFGGYLGNMSKSPVNIYRRIGEDQWEIVYTFPHGAINHVHNIVSDPFRNCLWIFTGDFGEAAAIWKVTDNFKKVERVACNNQKYRACVVFAIPEGLLYATDAPFADDYIYFLNPNTMDTKELFSIHGSCIYGCQWKDKYVFSSTVEGDGRNTPILEFLFGRKRGAGIKDDFVHMYIGNIKDGFKEIYKEKKDNMPYYTFQFGAFKFPAGVNNTDTLYFQPVATKDNDLRLMSLNWEDIK